MVRLEITEGLDETTYLNRIYLRVDGSRIIELDGMKKLTLIMNPVNMFELITSCSNKQLLRHSDDNYLVLNQGDEYSLEFTVPAGYDKINKLEFVAEGYYIEHYR